MVHVVAAAIERAGRGCWGLVAGIIQVQVIFWFPLRPNTSSNPYIVPHGVFIYGWKYARQKHPICLDYSVDGSDSGLSVAIFGGFFFHPLEFLCVYSPLGELGRQNIIFWAGYKPHSLLHSSPNPTCHMHQK